MASTKGPPPDPFYVFYGFNGGVSAVCFVELNERHCLLTGDSSGECVLWDLNTMKRIWSHQEEKELTQPSILSCGLWSRGIWAHFRGCCVRFWTFDHQIDEPVEFSTIPCAHIGFCGASVLTIDQDNFVALPFEKDERQHIEIFRLVDSGKSDPCGKIIPRIAKDSKPIGAPMCCILSTTETTTSNSSQSIDILLIIGFESGILQIWKLQERLSMLIAEESILQDTILAMDFLQSRMFGVCVSPTKSISCWHLTDEAGDKGGLRITRRDDISLPRAGVSSVRIRGDGKLFAIGGWDGKIRVFSSKTLAPLAVLQFHSDVVRCLAFSKGKINDRRLMAAGSKDGSSSLWTLYSD